MSSSSPNMLPAAFAATMRSAQPSSSVEVPASSGAGAAFGDDAAGGGETESGGPGEIGCAAAKGGSGATTRTWVAGTLPLLDPFVAMNELAESRVSTLRMSPFSNESVPSAPLPTKSAIATASSSGPISSNELIDAPLPLVATTWATRRAIARVGGAACADAGGGALPHWLLLPFARRGETKKDT